MHEALSGAGGKEAGTSAGPLPSPPRRRGSRLSLAGCAPVEPACISSAVVIWCGRAVPSRPFSVLLLSGAFELFGTASLAGLAKRWASPFRLKTALDPDSGAAAPTGSCQRFAQPARGRWRREPPPGGNVVRLRGERLQGLDNTKRPFVVSNFLGVLWEGLRGMTNRERLHPTKAARCNECGEFVTIASSLG